MSRKNNKQTQRNYYKFTLESESARRASSPPQRRALCLFVLLCDFYRVLLTVPGEKANALKREKKASKQASKLASGGTVKKPVHKGFRLKKGVRVKVLHVQEDAPGCFGKTLQRVHRSTLKHCCLQGIKVTDAESKQKVRDLLAAEQAMKSMDVDEWEEAPGR